MTKIKIIITVPIAEADALRQAIGQAGGGKIGNYSFCSFSSKGIGRFNPEAGANPTIGSVGNLEQVEEERIEITCNKEDLRAVVAAIKNNHSYEEPVIDIFELMDF